MEAQPAHRLRHRLVHAGDQPAVAEREEVLRREEAERRADAGRRDTGRPERLGRVLEERDAERGELGKRSGSSEEVHRDDDLRALRDPGGDVLRVDVERRGIDVGEDGRRPHAGDRLGRGVERERRADHLVAAPDPHRLEREDERVGPVGHAERARNAEIRGGLALERLHLGPEDEATRLEDLGEPLLELRDERRVLRLDVDERDHDRPSVPASFAAFGENGAKPARQRASGGA